MLRYKYENLRNEIQVKGPTGDLRNIFDGTRNTAVHHACTYGANQSAKLRFQNVWATGPNPAHAPDER